MLLDRERGRQVLLRTVFMDESGRIALHLVSLLVDSLQLKP